MLEKKQEENRTFTSREEAIIFMKDAATKWAALSAAEKEVSLSCNTL
jgi:hypothetical protein